LSDARREVRRGSGRPPSPSTKHVKDRRLIINETEASTIRMIFQRYAELGSVALLRAELDRLGIVSKRREGAMGQLSGGWRFSRGALYLTACTLYASLLTI
jgi:hypothetical protein